MNNDGGPRDWDFGWHPDPDRPGEERYWNGSEWTDRRMATAASTTERDEDRFGSTARWWIGGGVVLVAVLVITVVVVLIARADSIVEEDDDAEFREVSVTACEPPGLLVQQQVRGVAENGSEQWSDYGIEVAVFSSDGTRIAVGSTDVRGVEPGQRAVWSIDTDAAEEDRDDGSTCEVLSVERTASIYVDPGRHQRRRARAIVQPVR